MKFSILLNSIFTSVSEIFKHSTTQKEHQSETEMLKTLKRKDKAINFAEKLIFLADKSDVSSTKLYKYYRRNFFKYNS